MNSTEPHWRSIRFLREYYYQSQGKPPWVGRSRKGTGTIAAGDRAAVPRRSEGRRPAPGRACRTLGAACRAVTDRWAEGIMIYLDNAATSFPKPAEVPSTQGLELYLQRAALRVEGAMTWRWKPRNGSMPSAGGCAGSLEETTTYHLLFHLQRHRRTQSSSSAVLFRPGGHVVSSRLEHNSGPASPAPPASRKD